MYYNKMFTSGYFKSLPAIPKLVLGKTILKKEIQKITVQQLRIEVYNLIKSKNFILAADIWTMSCLGLRSTEMQEVIFYSQSGKMFDLIQFHEKKNNHKIVRVIPQSLK